MTQSIIVYRNPMEQAFWEGGYLIPIFGGCSVGLLAFALTYKITDKLLSRFRKNLSWHRQNVYATNTASVVGLAAGISTMLYLLN